MRHHFFAVLVACLVGVHSLGAQTLESLFAPYTFTSPNGGTMPYRLMPPEGQVSGEKYPLLVVLHGLGGKGNDNLAQLDMGTPQLDPYVRANFKSFTLLPQGSDGDFPSFGLWGDPASKSMAANPTGSTRMALELISHLLATRTDIDPQRVYLVGVSMGGSGVFEFLGRRPDLFACGVPVYLGGTPDTCQIIANHDIPLRLLNDDQTIPWSRDRLLQLGADVAHISRFVGDEGHKAYTTRFSQDNYALFRWMFGLRKDGPRVRMRHSGGSTVVTEYGNSDTYEIWLKTAPAANVTVTPLPDAQVSVSPTSLTFTPTNWAVKQTVTVSAVNDAVVEGTHRATIQHISTSSDPDYQGLIIQPNDVIVQEGDAKVRFTQSEWQVGEASGTATLTVRLEGNVTGAVSVDFATVAAGGATSDADFTAVSGTIHWPEGDRSDREISVPILDDNLAEGAEAFEVRLSNPVGLQLGTPSTAVVRISDDEYPGVFRIVTRYATANENSGDITFTVLRADGSLGPASVQVFTQNGTAMAGSDFNAVSQTLHWADGEQGEKSVTIFLNNDTLPEPTEWFTLALANATGASIGEPSSVTITLEDDDGFTVSIVDDFSDGGRSNGSDPQDVDWWYSGTGSQIAVRASVAGLTQTMGSGSGTRPSANQFLVAALPAPVTLRNPGDYLVLSCDLTRTRTDNFNSNIRLGFFEIAEASIPTADNFGAAAFNPALGYTAELPAEGQSGRTLRLRKDSDTAGNRMVDAQGSDVGRLLQVANSAIYLPNGGTPTPASLPLHVTFTLTKTETGTEIKLESSLGSTTYSVTDSTNPYTTFNTVALGWGSTTTDLHIDNIQVTSGGPVLAPVDSDGDGMPDAWEIANGLNPYVNQLTDPASSPDADGDGHSDFAEYLANTDPRSASSFFQSRLEIQGGQFLFNFETVVGRQYAVEATNDLSNPSSWAIIMPWTAGTGATFSVPIPASDAPRQFFRAVVRLP